MSNHDYAAARPPLHESPGDHTWEYVGQRGRCRDYQCADKGCAATHVEVAAPGGLDCPFHGKQFASPCYSCEATPWRDGSDWGRCTSVDVNSYGDPMRCALYAGHGDYVGHKVTCGSFSPGIDVNACWLPYAHAGDNHVTRDGSVAWVDTMIGPIDRKSREAWETEHNA